MADKIADGTKLLNVTAKHLTDAYQGIHHPEIYELGIPFYIQGVGMALQRIVFLNYRKKDAAEYYQLCNAAAFAQFAMGIIIQKNTRLYEEIKKNEGNLKTKKEDVEKLIFDLEQDIPSGISTNQPTYESVRKELNALHDSILGSSNKKELLLDLHALCALILGGSKTEHEADRDAHIERLNPPFLKKIILQHNSVCLHDNSNIRLSPYFSQLPEEKSARIIYAHMLIRYMNNMLKPGPIKERLDAAN